MVIEGIIFRNILVLGLPYIAANVWAKPSDPSVHQNVILNAEFKFSSTKAKASWVILGNYSFTTPCTWANAAALVKIGTPVLQLT